MALAVNSQFSQFFSTHAPVTKLTETEIKNSVTQKLTKYNSWIAEFLLWRKLKEKGLLQIVCKSCRVPLSAVKVDSVVKRSLSVSGFYASVSWPLLPCAHRGKLGDRKCVKTISLRWDRGVKQLRTRCKNHFYGRKSSNRKL